MALLDRWIASFAGRSEATPKAKGAKVAICEACETEFKKLGNSKTCSPVCSRELMRTRKQQPEYKEWQRAYDQRPEVKERQQARHQRPEAKELKRVRQKQPKYREMSRAYQQRPEVKEKVRALHQRPEYKERQRVQHQRPEYKERRRNNRFFRYRNDPDFRESCLSHARLRSAAKRHGITPRRLALMKNQALFRLIQEDSHATEADRQL